MPTKAIDHLHRGGFFYSNGPCAGWFWPDNRQDLPRVAEFGLFDLSLPRSTTLDLSAQPPRHKESYTCEKVMAATQ